MKSWLLPFEGWTGDAARTLALGAWAVSIAYALWSAWPLIGPIEPRDFSIFWVAGKAALSGQPEIAYNPLAFASLSETLTGLPRAGLPYPPPIFLLLGPLALLDLVPAFAVWIAVSAILFLWAARPYVRGFPSLLAILTPAGCISLALGQTGLLIGALWLLAFRRHGWAVGLLALKPHIGALAIFTLTERRRFLQAAAIGLMLIAASAALFPSAWPAFPDAILRQGAHLDDHGYRIWFFQVVSPRLGFGTAGWLMFAAAAACLLWRRFDVFTAATASVLISPYALHYDMTVACLGMGLALLHERRPLPLGLLLLGFFTPYLVLVGSTWLAPPLILGALYAQVSGKPVEPNGQDLTTIRW